MHLYGFSLLEVLEVLEPLGQHARVGAGVGKEETARLEFVVPDGAGGAAHPVGPTVGAEDVAGAVSRVGVGAIVTAEAGGRQVRVWQGGDGVGVSSGLLLLGLRSHSVTGVICPTEKELKLQWDTFEWVESRAVHEKDT